MVTQWVLFSSLPYGRCLDVKQQALMTLRENALRIHVEPDETSPCITRNFYKIRFSAWRSFGKSSSQYAQCAFSRSAKSPAMVCTLEFTTCEGTHFSSNKLISPMLAGVIKGSNLRILPSHADYGFVHDFIVNVIPGCWDLVNSRPAICQTLVHIRSHSFEANS